MPFQDQHVLITGGSSGIGLALAHQLAASGARLSLVARDPAKLDVARIAIARAFPLSAAVVTASADVAVEAEVLTALQIAENAHGPVDVLITSAGVAIPGYFENVPVEIFERTMAVNYFGTLYFLKAVVPVMRQRACGRIVLISSGMGLYGFFGYSPYAPGKFALRGLAECLRAELKDTGVTVTIVYPPDTATPQLAQENYTKPPETQALTALGGLWSAAAVARITLRAVRRGQFTVTPGLPLTMLFWFGSLFRPLVNWCFDRIVRRTRQRGRIRKQA